ncbi:hypothetical protein [Actinomadura rubrisoli]|uniref:Uncharacterized protein n=1 Tax=Actinomadura rubrisoli TaxID=2530368 RepID=A0A4R5AL39_9ACTN|nr:hypothetical protein [Actinomadura rubrisoli]TDD73668.1 hypothetical protein E1298_33575 [Actinomadura rubrisoli]
MALEAAVGRADRSRATSNAGDVVLGEAFIMEDNRVVTVELISGYLRLTMPEEIRMYGEAWDRLLWWAEAASF